MERASNRKPNQLVAYRTPFAPAFPLLTALYHDNLEMSMKNPSALMFQDNKDKENWSTWGGRLLFQVQ